MEDIVRVMENDTTGHRDAERYHFAVFGKPGPTGVWGWRMEGHHLSLNFVIRKGRVVSSTPHIFRAETRMRLPEGPLKGLRALEREEDLGMALVNSLDPSSGSKQFFRISLLMTSSPGNRKGEVGGRTARLAASKMNDRQMER